MENLKILKTKKEVLDLIQYLKGKDFIAFDTETDGVDEEASIIGFSICAELGVGYYVILSYWDKDNKRMLNLETAELAKQFMQELLNYDLIMHNAVFDCQMVKQNYQVDLMPKVHTDTMILGHLLNENRSNGLKERGMETWGQDARAEQTKMKQSVFENGGELTKGNYELYKADSDLIGYYGAKDAVLTLNLFYHDVEELFEQGLDKFFYQEESMPLLRGPTYELNTTGLKVDNKRLQDLKTKLQIEIALAKDFIMSEIAVHIKDKYPGDKKNNHFNIGSNQQLSWLLFDKLGNDFVTLTKGGKEVAKFVMGKLPYTVSDRRYFFNICKDMEGQEYTPACTDVKSGKVTKGKKIKSPVAYTECGAEVLKAYSKKYAWVAKLLEYKKSLKILDTYVVGIESRMKYGVIRPRFLQIGTTSGRYSSKDPNFQNLPRDDKRVKSCIVSRPGKVFVGADYSQLEPRVFASISGDKRLQEAFRTGDDFYSVLGVEVFERQGLSLKKDEPGSFAKRFPEERQFAKAFSLAATYGATAPRLSKITGKTKEEAQAALDAYFEKFPSVKNMMLESHRQAKHDGVVKSIFGRPRRMPEAKNILRLYGDVPHTDLPYDLRNFLNLAVNHKIQSTGASIMNRSAIKFYNAVREKGLKGVHIVMQVHDQLIVECPENLQKQVESILRDCMENSVKLPGVKLVADPFSSADLAGQK